MRQSGAALGKWAQVLAPAAVLLLLAIGITLGEERFLRADNLTNVLSRSVPLGLVAVGQTLIILGGQIDLSVGSVMGLAGMAATLALNANAPVALAVLVALGVGAAAGLLNGLVTTRLKVPAFVTTLAMMGLARGLLLLISGGRTVSGAGRLNDLLLQARLGLPLSAWTLFVTVAVVATWLGRSTAGRQVYAVGANPVAARLSGVRVERRLVLLFVLSGLLVGLAGAVECGRNRVATTSTGELMELDSIAAVVIGGASLNGGIGGVGGSVLGVAILAVLRNGCGLLLVPPEYEKVIVGPLIVLAVLYDRWLRRRRGQAT
ncbi:MAG: ABC transporter permease [Fimbriimonadaceae bacterium]|nr:ABC transporter permease [Fimbriimonadaceae bacterium]